MHKPFRELALLREKKGTSSKVLTQKLTEGKHP